MTPIIAAIVAFLVVVGLAVAAIFVIPKMMGKDDNKSGQGTTTTSASSSSSKSPTTSAKTRTSSRTSTSAAASGSAAKLMQVLPDGYDAGVCTAIAPVTDAVASVDCEKNSKTGGPEVARYSLFPDQATLDAHFEAAYKEDEELLSCPGSNTQSPTTWHFTSTPDQVEGQVACGSYKNSPDIVWTRNSDLLLGDAQGPELAPLHEWWLQFG